MLAERSERHHHPGSDPETALHQLLRTAGIEGWAPQVEIFDADEFVARPDVVFQSLRIVIEVDSWSWHADRKRRREDVRRQNCLERLGLTVLRFFWEDVMHDPAYVLCEIRKALPSVSSPTIGAAAAD